MSFLAVGLLASLNLTSANISTEKKHPGAYFFLYLDFTKDSTKKTAYSDVKTLFLSSPSMSLNILFSVQKRFHSIMQLATAVECVEAFLHPIFCSLCPALRFRVVSRVVFFGSDSGRVWGKVDKILGLIQAWDVIFILGA